MNATDIFTIVGIGILMVASSWGTHPFTARRLWLPIVAAGGVAYHYLSGVPTAGNDIIFETLCALAGVTFGLLAATQVRMHREETTGRVLMTAGIGYAA